VSLAVSVMACSFERPPNVGADDGGAIDADPGNDGAGEAPTVTATTPVDVATDAEPDGVVTATFSEEMDSATITASTFVITSGETSIAGQVNYDARSRSATFQPDTRLALLTGYTATITAGVTDAGGTPMASDHSWTFSVRDGAWGTAQLIETDNGGNASNPDVAGNALGEMFAVWHQYDGTRNNIWANRFVPGTGWAGAQLIETDNAGSATSPSVDVDGTGIAVAVWTQSDGTRTNVWANRFVTGTGWGTAQLIETDNAGNASDPAIAVAAGGDAVAVWSQFDGTRSNIWANRYVPGVGWGAAILVETDDAGFASFPQVAIDPAGNAVAVWSQSDGSRYNVLANRFIPGTGWGTSQLIEAQDSGTITNGAQAPNVALDDEGNALASWSQYDGTRYNAWANRFVPGTGWASAQLIETDNGGTASSGAAGPHVAIDNAGNVIVVWSQSDGTRTNIWANRFVPGSGWGAAHLIETDNAGNGASPRVDLDAAGNAVAVWFQNDGTRNNIWANRYRAGSGWSAAELIEGDNAGSAVSPRIASSAAGTALSVWSQSDGTRTNIWANTFQ
jgi:hypothetical protein